MLLEESAAKTQLSTAVKDAAETEIQCEICGQLYEEIHACLQSIPSSVLTLQDPRIGSVVVDHYILEEFVCDSNTSFVYRARHQLLNTHVAVKISNKTGEHDPFSLLRTSRAALIAMRLEHPNIVKCYEFSQDPGHNAVLVMEWSHGTPLSHLIAQEGQLTTWRALNLLEGLCDGLRYAQSQGVNHINLKPNGILIEQVNGCEQARLLDFGLMKMLGPHTHESMQNSDHFKYASPEERAGQPPDQRSMIYSLGLILFDMLTARVEAINNSRSDTKIEYPALVKIHPQLKEAALIDKVLTRCLAFKPSKRFQTIDDLAFAIGQVKIEVERMERTEKFMRDEFHSQANLYKFLVILLIVSSCVSAYFAANGY